MDKAQDKIELLSEKHFESILSEVLNQVTRGKGKERHGHNCDFKDQPWRIIADNVGNGFSIGQAIKKLMELKTHSKNIDEALEDGSIEKFNVSCNKWRTDAIGAIVYTIMAIMYNDSKNSRTEKQILSI